MTVLTRPTMVQGDARHLNEIWRLHGFASPVDLIVTSPPYAQVKDYGSEGQIGHGQSYELYLDDMALVFEELATVSGPSTSMWMVVDTFRAPRRAENVAASLIPLPFDLSARAYKSGWILRDVVIWHKDRTLPWSSAGRLRNAFEYVLLFVRSESFHYAVDEVRLPIRSDGWVERFPERHNPGGAVPTNVWEFPIPIQGSWRSDSEHMCPLPPGLVDRLVRLSSQPGNLVVDPFAGSGVVLTVAAARGRNAVGVELNETYVRQFDSNLQVDLPSGVNADPGVSRQDAIQARRIKLAAQIGRLLAKDHVPPLLSVVEDACDESRLPATMNLSLVFRRGSERPATRQLEDYLTVRPLSKFGLDVSFTCIAEQTWARRAAGSVFSWNTSKAFWRLDRSGKADEVLESCRTRPARLGPPVAVRSAPSMYLAGVDPERG